jgi:hypothetical protein
VQRWVAIFVHGRCMGGAWAVRGVRTGQAEGTHGAMCTASGAHKCMTIIECMQ